MKSQPGTKLKAHCEKIHISACGVSTVLFLKGFGSHYIADDCKAVLIVVSALATCPGHTPVIFNRYSSVPRQ